MCARDDDDAMPPALPEECPPPVEGIDFFLGLFLLVGTLVSFLPQHIKLILKTSHVGLSLYKGAVGTMTATCGVFYFSALQYYELFYCGANDPFIMFGHIMPLLQLGLILVCDVTILFLYIYYFDLKWYHDNDLDPHKAWTETKFAVLGTFIFQLVIASVFAGLAFTQGFGSPAMENFGFALIIGGSIGQLVQWGPQIFTTYRLKRVGSLSLPMIFLQAGGAALTAYFFSVDGDGWYIWAPFVVASVLLTVLFIESIYFMRKEKHKLAAASTTSFSTGNVQFESGTEPLLKS